MNSHTCQCGCSPCTCFGPVVNGQLPACPPRFPCTCGLTPCICPGGRGPFVLEDDVNPNKNYCTVCTGDKTNNIWYVNGKCKLDELTYEQVWIILLRNPNAKADLQRITSDPTLLQLAANTNLIQNEIESNQRVAKRINGPAPYYYSIKGNTDGSIF